MKYLLILFLVGCSVKEKTNDPSSKYYQACKPIKRNTLFSSDDRLIYIASTKYSEESLTLQKKYNITCDPRINLN